MATPLKRGFFKKSATFQKIMEKGDAGYEIGIIILQKKYL
jgi:hypothetical protein